MGPKVYKTLEEFYPFYLSQHQNKTCRRLHFIGTTGGLLCMALGLAQQDVRYLPVGIVFGYLCAWIGHFFFEKNRPATFQYPLLSFVCDWKMWLDMLLGRIAF